MRALPSISVAVLTLGLSGCATPLQPQDLLSRSAAFIDWSTSVLSAQGQRLSDYAGSLVDRQDQQQREAEVQALFAQKQIDPLTRYLETHSGDRSRANQLGRVAREREIRCEEIARLYRGRDASRENLVRLRTHYLYSCPLEVAEFADRVKRSGAITIATLPRAEPAPAPAPTSITDDEPLAKAVSRQHNRNCYLLYTIRNYRQAIDACREPAEYGDAKAQHHMASMALVRRDFPAARSWAERAAAQNHPPALLLLGELHHTGQGTAKNSVRALELIRQAADAGLPEAAHQAGQFYQQGLGGPIDLPRAEAYFRRAAQRDHLPSHLALATLYENTRRPVEARDWLEQAARKGSAEAQFLLGQQHSRGTEASDAQEAYVWYSLALLNGEARAKPEIVRQEARLSKDQLTSAQARIQAGINGQWQ